MVVNSMSYATYDSYKESGVDWLGEIPSDWDVLRLKNTVNGCVNGFWGDEPKGANDIIVLRVADFNRDNLKIFDNKLTYRSVTTKELSNRLLKYGDLLIEKSGGGDKTLVGCVVLFDKNYKAITSNFVGKLTPYENFHSVFLNYVFSTLYFCNRNYLSIKQTTGIQNLDTTSYLNEFFCFPNLKTQTKIANFLDQKTAQIDQAIALKQQQIEKLGEYKQIVIQNAVTKGLNPNAPMKNSGVDWIGDIPEHWKIDKLKNILSSVSIKNHPNLPLLSITREKGVIERDIEDQESNHNFIPDDLSGYKLLKKGQFGMNKMKAWQGSYGVSDFTGIVSPAYYIFDINEKLNKNFFSLAIRSKFYVGYFASASDGVRIGQWDLNKTRMKEIPFIIPSIEEQKAIYEFSLTINQQVKDAIEKYQIQIDRLKEYKNILINQAVTGKIKI